eukprot:m.141445 g.141445  ORF g.141445 m.141445 type:complete len:1202 (+) comp16694_c0_seq1:90-3695(+)
MDKGKAKGGVAAASSSAGPAKKQSNIMSFFSPKAKTEPKAAESEAVAADNATPLINPVSLEKKRSCDDHETSLSKVQRAIYSDSDKPATSARSPPPSVASPPAVAAAPKTEVKQAPAAAATSTSNGNSHTAKNSNGDDDEDDAPISTQRKRKMKTIDSDDEDLMAVTMLDDVDDEINAAANASSKNATKATTSNDSDEDDKPIVSLKKKPNVQEAPRQVTSPTSSMLSKFAASSPKPLALKSPPSSGSRTDRASPPSSSPSAGGSGGAGGADGDEERYWWLEDQRDAQRRAPNDPEYDPTTLYIPADAFRRLKPFEQQYWSIKKDRWDVILFFKKGKFYELYEKDAEIGHREFDLKFTDRVNMKMVGVPEGTFTLWASKFLGLGYKVAKVDERESALAKEMREKKTGQASASKIIERSLSAVYTQGTLMGEFLVGDASTYILSVKENVETREFGICFADTGSAEFNFCSFTDDNARTQFETLIVQIKPRELVYEKNGLSKETLSILKAHVTDAAARNVLQPITEFWDAARSREELERGGFTKDKNGVVSEVLQKVFTQPLTLSALGGLTFYLRSLLIDRNLLSQGNFRMYDPLRQGGSLLLDGQTLQNLEILENNIDRGIKGTLQHLLLHCLSPFGKRMFRKWLCHPLRNISDINDRLNAVDDLEAQPALCDRIASLLREAPDLERLIARVHTGSCRLADFLDLLDAFDSVEKTIKAIAPTVSSLASRRLQELLTVGRLFPDISATLAQLRDAFDRKKARNDGNIVPNPGADREFDALQKTVESIEGQLEAHLVDAQKKFGKIKISYHHPTVGKERYQIQVPASEEDSVPSSWKCKSQTTTLRRYWSPEVERLQKPLAEAQETRKQILNDMLSRTLQSFDAHNADWTKAMLCLSEVDCLLSLFYAKQSMGAPMCRPQFIESDTPVLDVAQLRHPCLLESGAVSDYIPNDTVLGGSSAPVLVLTGPNMGGKSTLLRQTCVAVIMAQIGCHVPAEHMRLTPVDRIFTRIGANDNIVAGRSTFMVELKETANILLQASPHSLVVLDELGRGTSTFDGYAIACAVLSHIAEKTKCRTLFATHFHHLTEEFSRHPDVRMGHMAFHVPENQRDVTFLYKLEDGVCPKSFGMNVASMAGLPAEVVAAAESKAADFEQASGFKSIEKTGLLCATDICAFRELMALAAKDSFGNAELGRIARLMTAVKGA